MKTKIIPLVLAGLMALSASLQAQSTPNASVAPDTIFDGQSVTLIRDGNVPAGIAYLETIIWAPDGTYESSTSLNFGSESYTPQKGPGTYWYLFRIVDSNSDVVDQWNSFTVLANTLTANASISPDPINFGESVTITRDGRGPAGIAYSEGTIWAPDGTYDSLAPAPLGTESYTPHNGPGTYWLQFRLVDNHNEFVDQWISFTVM